MANKDIRTNVTITAETKGFDTAQQKQTKFADKSAKDTAAQVKGFEDAQKSSIAFGKSLEKLNKMSLKDAQKQIGGLKDHLEVLKKNQYAATESMEKMEDKGGSAYKKIKDHLKDVTKESKTTERQIDSLTKSFASQAVAAEKMSRLEEKRKGAFVQGMAQGGFAIPGIGLQRGPGMGRQMAGMAVGMGLRGGMGAARGMGSVAMGGVGGLAQGLSGIPLIGGAAAGMLTTAAGYAQQNLQWQRTKLGMAPVIESNSNMMGRRDYLKERSKSYRKAKSREVSATSEYNELAGEQRYLMIEQDRRWAAGKRRLGLKKAKSRIAKEGMESPTLFKKLFSADADHVMEMYDASPNVLVEKSLKMNAPEIANRVDELTGLMKAQRGVVNKATVAAGKAMRSASKKYGKGPFRGVGGMGLDLMGVSKMEAGQMAGQIAQAGGGYIDDAQSQGMIGAAFAAKTSFGVDAGTSGAFYGAGRRGGLVGGGDSSSEAFKKTLAEGLEMGLSKSEVAKWMQETAQGIQQFQSTGIPINTTSISALQGDISGAGITGTRALAMSRGITGGLQGIGQRGIGSGLDHMMLQLVGGYKGGGAEDYRAARSRLEEMNLEGQGVGDIAGNTKVSDALRKIMGMAGGDKASQAEMLQQTVTKLGGRGSVKDFDWLANMLRGEGGSPEQQAAITAEMKRREEGASGAGKMRDKKGTYLEGLARASVEGYAPSAKADAGIKNRQIAAGGKVIGNVQKLERASLNVTDAFNTLTKGPLTDFSDVIEILTGRVKEAALSFGGEGPTS